MMFFSPYEYMNAAQQYCYSQEMNPSALVKSVIPNVPNDIEQWMSVAWDMHKIRMQIVFMRQYGVQL